MQSVSPSVNNTCNNLYLVVSVGLSIVTCSTRHCRGDVGISQQSEIIWLASPLVSIPVFHADAPGLIPGGGTICSSDSYQRVGWPWVMTSYSGDPDVI